MNGWIKMRIGLVDEPEVFALSTLLRISRFEVVGHLYKFWVWCSDHTTNGEFRGISPTDLKKLLRLSQRKSLTEALEKVGWLEKMEDGFRIPKWEKYFGGIKGEELYSYETRQKLDHEFPSSSSRVSSEFPSSLENPPPTPPSIYPDEMKMKKKMKMGEPLDFKGIQQRFNETVPVGIRHSVVFTKRMKVGLAARCKEYPDFVERMIQEVSDLADWVQTGSWFDLAWILTSEENARKLLEGKLHGMGRKPVHKTKEQLLEEYHQERIAKYGNQQVERETTAVGNGNGNMGIPRGDQSENHNGDTGHPW